MRDSTSVAKTYDLDKGGHIKVQNFTPLTAHVKFHQICTCKSTEKFCLITLKNNAKFEENQFIVSKLTRIW